ncbi:DUF1439 domain-containing protein [Thorsellia anophelis]|uniref:Lipoprotein n=1 Tax=Thorsellia anophelis DSM 18579 TaxID=1123402 RepID=A0A1I0B4M3_9GAMM|nr:DUF1439 domain-containing protein [Thorsellia anophelis]SET01060.1 Protein of unknown function [Thorsellia anophelis DSM 18579]
MKKLLLIIISVVAIALFFFIKPFSYSLTEERVNRYFIERADSEKFNKQIAISDLAEASIKLSDMTAQIGRREPNKIQFDAKASIDVKSLLGNRDTTLTFSLSAAPYYNADERAIYVKDVEILNATTESSSVNAMMPVMKPILEDALSSYFETKPVYQLNPEKRWKEKLAYRFGKGIEVVPGNIIITFRD